MKKYYVVVLVRDYDYHEDETYRLEDFNHEEVNTLNLKDFLESIEQEVKENYACQFKSVISWQEVKEV